MQIAQAIEIIEQYREQEGLGFLEALVEIRQSPEQFSNQQILAYRIFMMMGQEMFQPA